MVETDMVCSQAIQEYFNYLDENTKKAFDIATKARKLGFDPEDFVEIKLAKNMAERVVGIISVIAPQIINSGVVERIIELEKEYGSQDWRVAFRIAHEISEEKYCSFKDKIEAIEVGIRTGFAYVTVGVVSSPLEGLTSIEIKKRRDGKGEYFRLNYAGPIRNAGGTAAATSVLIADYVRKKLGYAKYDPDEKEIKRCYAELEDYHEYVANLQYFPYKEESEFLLKNIPVEIAGDPSEKRELSNASLKDLARVETNLLRSGYCLIHSSCIPLKAPKLWKKLDEWGEDMGMSDWNFIGEHIKMVKELKADAAKQSGIKKEIIEKDSSNKNKLKPDPTFVKDLVGGRPVIGHPMSSGSFRLRYGRSRASGYSGQAIHPATMAVLNDFIATGTQLKVERPGKATSFTPCDTIDGPIVKLKNGSVLYLDNEEEAKNTTKEVEEILYVGDVLINYGDFFDRAHMLVPPGYCEEIWILYVQEILKKKQLEGKKFADVLNIPEEAITKLLFNPLTTKVSFSTAKAICEKINAPLHPQHIYFYSEINLKDLENLFHWLANASFQLETPKIILPRSEEFSSAKRSLELIGMPHEATKEHIIISGDRALSLSTTLNVRSQLDVQDALKLISENKDKNSLEIINILAPYEIRDKSGVFIGARMGRPEKAKMRKMTGSPHGLFPVGDEGGRLRSFQSALEKGKITSSFPVFLCPNCKNKTPFSICDMCETKTIKQKINAKTKEEISPEEAKKNEEIYFMDYKTWSVPIKSLFDYSLRKMKTRIYPDLIKGVRGTVGKDHTPEHLIKAILRSKNGVHVNKDGTVRYDASEVTLTHFKPNELGTNVEKLRELGYKRDIYGVKLEDENQILELLPQDVVLPACPDALDEGSDDVLFRTTKFIDEQLKIMYDLPPFYNLKNKKDLIGHLIIGLAPHTSAGMVGRIIGFSKTQGFLAHPLYHAAMRRDCDGDESCLFLVMDGFLNFSRKYLGTNRGSTMDAPLVLTSLLNPAEVDDMAFNLDIVDKYPLEFYQAANEYKMPWEIKIERIEDNLFTEKQFEGSMFTHNTSNINTGVLCSSYKTLPSMAEKIEHQMDLASKIRAVKTSDVARLIIEKHFIRDTKGNLRKFSLQQFRCVGCNKKFRRPPLAGKCDECNGKIIFTIHEGSIIKYLDMSIKLAEEYNVSDYLKESLYLTKKRIVDVFGKDKEKQSGLGDFI
ncbi:MAG: DNA polymerase II large subunit [Nanoarchaeota archaeon]|nr:DNA polymerase II large subunit [Nanoarchaeota archaeon]